jgi:acyl-CoA reductase-like NAD-dependent aldehyde dehydrogenase
VSAAQAPGGSPQSTLGIRAEAFIDGRFQPAAGGETFEAIAPRDGRVITAVARCREADIDRAVRAARRAFEDGGWAMADPRERRRVLLALAELIDQDLERLALIESSDTGHPIDDARGVDVPGARATFAYYAEALDKLYGEIAPTGPDALALISREPLGVIGAVVPWNYPLIITAWKLAPALAAGNSVVLKPAEQSPLSALALAELAARAGLPDGVLNVVPGFGEEAGEPLGRHPDVDKITFTGSVEVGRRFLRYAGESNGKAVSLELGGKSPHVVLADAGDLDRAAEAIGWGIFYNAGQTCHAGSRVVVSRELAGELRERLVHFASSMNPEDPALPGTRLGAMIGHEHLAGVLARVREATERGSARLLTGGEPAVPVDGGSYMFPTVLDAPDPADAIVQEEVFGPVLVIQEAADEAEAVRLANGTGYGLAAAVWSSELSRAHRVARALRAGTVWVNTFDASSLATPFGGVKASGQGRDRSLHALDSYVALKTTWIGL